MVDGYIYNGQAAGSFQALILVYYQVLLVVTLWLSGIVVDQTFTLGGVDVRACLFIVHCRVDVSIRVLNFHGLNCEYILTANFSYLW